MPTLMPIWNVSSKLWPLRRGRSTFSTNLSKRLRNLKYLGVRCFRAMGHINAKVTHRVSAGWTEWRQADIKDKMRERWLWWCGGVRVES